jgi:hypothetical protein
MSNSTIPQGAVWWVCSDEAYDRIVAAVGKEPAKSRDHLVSDLLNRYSQLLLFKALDSDNGAKARRKLFSGIVKDAICLQMRLLAHKEYAARALIPDELRRHAFLSELDRIVGGAEASRTQGYAERPPTAESPAINFAAVSKPRLKPDRGIATSRLVGINSIALVRQFGDQLKQTDSRIGP